MVSLIVATLNRTAELDRLLASLDSQSYREFEVIVVDQNPDDRLIPLLRKHAGLSIKHLRCARGLSRARNIGLGAANGEIVAIPDDDCWYPEPLLKSVTEWFDLHPGFGVLSVIKRSADNTPVGPRWPDSARQVTTENVWECAISSTIFMRRLVTDKVGAFHEGIGVGAPTKYQSGEETDYLLRALEMGSNIWYEPTITVHHPPLGSIDRLRRSTYPFALGSGYVMRVHGYSWGQLTNRLIRSFGGAAFSLCKGKLDMAEVYVLRAAGQLRGYCLGPRDLARIAPSRTI